MLPNAITKRPPEIQAARNSLRGKGYTITTCAERLNVTRHHLSLVLNNRRSSRRILRAIQDLPENPTNPA